VRSSAQGEDGDHTSFAGQYDTVLNVQGIDALKSAINQCVASLHSDRAEAYQHEQQGSHTAGMHVVVQVMVDAVIAGVLFTADPISGRHDRCVIDVVAGLGEALVSGETSAEHYETDDSGHVVHQELLKEQALLSSTAIERLVTTANDAAKKLGSALDFEWAIDSKNGLHWLQGRPITTVGSDLNELDTPIPTYQVITRCNVGEMMPGAICPLTFSVQGRAIEHGMQHMHVCWGARQSITQEWTQINMFFGHLFINMSGSLAAATSVSITTAHSLAQSVCGRPVPELREPLPRHSFLRRWVGSWKFLRYCMQAPEYVEDFEARFRHMHIAYYDDSRQMMQEMDRQFAWLCEANEVHLRSSTGSSLMEGITQGIVSGGKIRSGALAGRCDLCRKRDAGGATR
jgi:pyruvate,water dikinase